VVPPAPAPGTKAITPENPIPRRLSSVPIPYPAQLKGSGYRANLMVRVTLEASGAVSDVRQVSIETAGGDATSPDGRVRAVEAFAAAAAEAVKQWRYQPPADPPIAFFVAVTFEGERDALAVQSESPAGQGPWSTSTVRFNLSTAATPADMERLDRLLTDMLARRAEFAQRLQPGHPDLQKLDEQIREIERARNLQQRGVATVASVAGPGSTAATPVRVGGNIPPPTKTNNVSPDYPEIAKVARVQGVVILETTIDEQGRVANARVLRSIPLLDQAALDAVRLWQFTPTLLNGSPVPVIMTVTVQFGLPPQ
jgi:protein TonB